MNRSTYAMRGRRGPPSPSENQEDPVSTEAVAAMYARYPYPSPVVAGGLAFDIANLFSLLCTSDALAGRKVLDAGCGTGQRVVGFAHRNPDAQVHGIDFAEP